MSQISFSGNPHEFKQETWANILQPNLNSLLQPIRLEQLRRPKCKPFPISADERKNKNRTQIQGTLRELFDYSNRQPKCLKLMEFSIITNRDINDSQ